MDPRTFARKEIKAAAGLALACVMAACPGGDPVLPAIDDLTSTSHERETHLILLLDDVPQPGYIVVEATEVVEWRNAGNHDHSVSTYGTPDEWEDTLLKPGQSFLHSFSQPGEYAYICVVHGEVGSVTVVEDMYGDMDMDRNMGMDMNP